MAKTNPYTDSWLRQQGMVEVSKGVFEKLQDKVGYSKGPTKIIGIKNTLKDGSVKTILADKPLILNNVCHVNMKPMSVNGAWQGRRFKSDEYKAYTDSCMSILPNIELPLPPYRINFTFGVSNPASDWDNPVKPIQDILQSRYKFNDKDIYEAFVKKVIVPKRMEYFEFEILHLEL